MTQVLDTNRSKASLPLKQISQSHERATSKQMLLIVPVPFRVQNNKLCFESQACNGLEQWADNFKSVIVAAPIIPEELATNDKTMTWRSVETLAAPERFEFVPLPWAYSPGKFLSDYHSVRNTLGELIKRCHYLQFAIGGMFGDWAAVGALEAHKQGRAYAIHTDRVEHQVLVRTSKEGNLKAKLKASVMAPLMAIYHRHIIKNSALGLWHGQDCYDAYSPFCKNSHVIHDIHTKATDIISASELSQKINHVKSDETLRICYAGRLDPMKAPFDWVQAVEVALKRGVKLHATWMGDGSLFAQTQEMIAQRGLNDAIELVGFESDRSKLLKSIKEAHVMLFTHITPESPRCLIESLTCGTPIVGYQSEYAQDLLKNIGGGLLTPINDWQKLGELLVCISQDREKLSHLIEQAGKNGARFHDQAVFEERSNLIKSYLSEKV